MVDNFQSAHWATLSLSVCLNRQNIVIVVVIKTSQSVRSFNRPNWLRNNNCSCRPYIRTGEPDSKAGDKEQETLAAALEPM